MFRGKPTGRKLLFCVFLDLSGGFSPHPPWWRGVGFPVLGHRAPARDLAVMFARSWPQRDIPRPSGAGSLLTLLLIIVTFFFRVFSRFLSCFWRLFGSFELLLAAFSSPLPLPPLLLPLLFPPPLFSPTVSLLYCDVYFPFFVLPSCPFVLSPLSLSPSLPLPLSLSPLSGISDCC
jgi:hypothetical protein